MIAVVKERLLLSLVTFLTEVTVTSSLSVFTFALLLCLPKVLSNVLSRSLSKSHSLDGLLSSSSLISKTSTEYFSYLHIIWDSGFITDNPSILGFPSLISLGNYCVCYLCLSKRRHGEERKEKSHEKEIDDFPRTHHIAASDLSRKGSYSSSSSLETARPQAKVMARTTSEERGGEQGFRSKSRFIAIQN